MNKTLLTLIGALMLVCPMSARNNVERVNEIVGSVKAQYAPDKRQEVYEVDAKKGKKKTVVLTGKMSEQTTHDALVAALDDAQLVVVDSITVLPANEWAQVKLSVANMKTEGSHASEMATQALMGTPLRVLERGNSWWRVQTPDGYISYINETGVVSRTPEQLAEWRKAPRLIVTAPFQTHAFVDSVASGLRDIVTDLILGDIVEGQLVEGAKRVLVTLPDGRQGWVETSDVTPIEGWAAQTFDAEKILDTAYSMMGSPYFWGGASIKMLDCSGLSKTSYFANGIILMRDASQQATTGTHINPEDWRTCEAGDLLFFGNANTGKVTHVAIYEKDGQYIHSSGRVKVNSVDPTADNYLTTPFLHAVRINGNQGTRGITRAADHPWYFEK